MKKNIKLFKFFTDDNKSGYKTKEKWLKTNHNGLYCDIINNTSQLKKINFKEKVWLYVHGLTKKPKCECGKELTFKKSFKGGYGRYCSIMCANKSKSHINAVKGTNIKKFGGVSPIHSKDIKNKIKNTNLEKYGVSNIFEDINFIKSKTLDSCGVDHISKLSDVKSKIRETNLKRYGVSTPLLLNKSRLNKVNNGIKLFKDKYNHLNVISALGDNIVIECDNCNKQYSINRSVLYHRNKITTNPCTICHPIKSGVSIIEKRVVDFINTLNVPFETNNRVMLNGKELDIYIPSKNIAIELNGLYWHSELYLPKDYHLNKTELCNSKGIQLIHIFEDEWLNKEEIVKSRLKNILGLTETRIYGRKCEIKEVPTKIKSKFLDNNHIQGKVGSKVNLGLYYNDELVSLMTFGKRIILKNVEWELIRFCNKLDTTVIGGASKLLKHFIKNYNPDEIISYADRRWSSGKLYSNLGFSFDSVSELNYYYIINNNRENRIKYQKHKLVKLGFEINLTEHQIMKKRGYYRIYDCGNIKFKLKNTQ